MPLHLTVNKGKLEFKIGDDIYIKVSRLKSGSSKVRVTVDAPKELRIKRLGEVVKNDKMPNIEEGK